MPGPWPDCWLDIFDDEVNRRVIATRQHCGGERVVPLLDIAFHEYDLGLIVSTNITLVWEF